MYYGNNRRKKGRKENRKYGVIFYLGQNFCYIKRRGAIRSPLAYPGILLFWLELDPLELFHGPG